MGASILYAAAVIGIVGILAGILLGVASEKFKVKVDEKEIKVREALPGNNCGGCGYPGCDGLAAAIDCVYLSDCGTGTVCGDVLKEDDSIAV